MLFLCYFFMSVSHPFMSASQNLLLYLRVTPALVYPRCSDFLAPCYGCVIRSSFSVTCHVHPSVNDSKTVLLTRKPDFPPLLFTELTFFYLFFSPFDWSCSASTCPTGRPILQLTCEFEVDVFVSLSDKIKNN